MDTQTVVLIIAAIGSAVAVWKIRETRNLNDSNARIESDKRHDADRQKDAMELETFRAQMAKELEEYRALRAEREAQTAQSIALAATMQAEVVKQLAAIAGAQKQTTVSATKAEKRIIAAGATASEGLAAAIAEVLSGIVKLTSGQVDQTTAINFLRDAVSGLVDKLNDTPGGEDAVAAIEDAIADGKVA